MKPSAPNLKQAPFLRRGPTVDGMMAALLAGLSVIALHYGLRYDQTFLWRFPFWVMVGLGFEMLYYLLNDGALRKPRWSTAVTAALLMLSIPARITALPVLCGLGVAIGFGKLTVDRNALRLNPMLLGRLFMMLLFADPIQRWHYPDVPPDVVTSATPLGLRAAEGISFDLLHLLTGDIGGTWGGIYAIVPGSPGDLCPPLILLIGLALYWKGVLDWRSGFTFIAGFAGTCLILRMPLAFHVLAGSIFFTAVFIVSDPRSMPASRWGRLAAGLLAGILNAVIRRHGYYPEGVVLAVLAVNLLSPTLDRFFFYARGFSLKRKQDRFSAPHPENPS